MADLFSALVGPIAKLLLKDWLGDTASEMGWSLVEIAKGKLDDHKKAMEAKRKATRVAEGVIQDVGAALAAERVADDDLESAVDALATTIERHVSAEFLVSRSLDAAAIERALVEARPVESIYRDRNDPARGCYLRLVQVLAPRLREAAPEIGDYALERDTKLLQGAEWIKDAREAALWIKGLLEQRAKETRRQATDYERRYRDALRSELRKLRLFGLDRHGDTPTDLPLSIAYIPLRLSLGSEKEGASLRLDYAELLALLPLLGNRLLIEGVAGSGKTTLLQWTVLSALDAQEKGASSLPEPLAVVRRVAEWLERAPNDKGLAGLRKACDGMLPASYRSHGREMARGLAEAPMRFEGAAETEEAGGAGLRLPPQLDAVPWWRRTPFFLRLRKCADGRLPAPDALPAEIAQEVGQPPEHWVLERLESGEALLLLDGIDEVPLERRDEMRESIEKYIESFEGCQLVVTSRPAAVREAGWARLFEPWRAQVKSMAPVDIERFIEQWHQALAAECRSRDTDSVDPETIERLQGQILTTPALAKLAETPLLCAAICYLHRVRSGEIPRRAVELYEKLCEQLVHRLDEQRMRKEGAESLAPALRGLDLQDKLQLLTRLAHFMVRERASVLSTKRASNQLTDELRRLRKLNGRKPNEVLAALQERSGVLRGASEKEVEFAHNALKSYLAAGRFAGDDSTSDVIDKSFATADPDLPVLAAARGGDLYREQLITELLQRADDDTTNARALRIMAVRCGVTGGVDKTQAAMLTGHEKKLFPPRDPEEARQLAELGERVVPLLRNRRGLAPETAAACVRALRLVGGTAAQAALATYLGHDDDKVVDELAQALNPLRIEKIKAFVADREQPWKTPEPLRHLREHDLDDLDILPSDTETLNLNGSGLRQLECLRRFTQLEWLVLDNTPVQDLSPLAGLAGLQALGLDGTPVQDLSPLAGLAGLQRLVLDNTPVQDLSPLAGLAGLQALGLAGTPVQDLSPLAGLAGLQALGLAGTPVQDLSPLSGLAGLQVLYLAGTPVADLSPLSGLAGLQWLRLAGTPVQDLAPLVGLAGLQGLWLAGTRVPRDDAALAALRARGVRIYM